MTEPIPQTPPTPDPVPDPKKGEKPDPVVTFTKDQVDASVSAATASALKALMEKLGVTDEKEAAALVGEARTAAEAKKTEEQKQQEAMTAVTGERDNWKSKYELEHASRLQDMLRFETVRVLTAQGASFPDDVYLFIQSNKKDELAAALGADERIDTKKIESIISAVKTDRPTYFGTVAPARTPGSPSLQKGVPPVPEQSKKDTARRQMANNIRRGF